jgi:CBS domain-containing protein
MLLTEVMTGNIQMIENDASIHEAAMLMRDLDVGMLPVREGDRLVGTVTDRDITVRATAESRDPASTPVLEIMTHGIISGYEDDETDIAIETMKQNQVRRLLVLDHDDRCVGILSIGDIALRNGEPEMSEELLEEVSKPAA